MKPQERRNNVADLLDEAADALRRGQDLVGVDVYTEGSLYEPSVIRIDVGVGWDAQLSRAVETYHEEKRVY